ncbi:MAG TPA: NAD(P)H-dependent oxidoreductase subunit E [Syntrophales bacterium]|mgnify:CR=1 FL=1|nr:NAD(P)H-dependent oxidoreductase subunit E [Syntrophales bacterium]HOL59807.1 NAD(P)H-dependent oxidoreductase subunit E [Syntrophales bacterium]HPO35975.1 NAD(P)H-dependent oxidoreductase subunit E [Syntrophales bacterium]
MKEEKDELLKEFTPEQVAKLDEIIERYKDKPGSLIPVLEEAQMLLEYLPVSVQKRIANGLNLPFSRVFGVVTFYSFFTMTPRGRHTIRVCLGTACYVRGGKAIAETLEKTLGVKEGETTADRRFTYETVRCLGACGLGPVVVIDNEVHGRMKPAKLKDTLNKYQ